MQHSQWRYRSLRAALCSCQNQNAYWGPWRTSAVAYVCALPCDHGTGNLIHEVAPYGQVCSSFPSAYSISSDEFGRKFLLPKFTVVAPVTGAGHPQRSDTSTTSACSNEAPHYPLAATPMRRTARHGWPPSSRTCRNSLWSSPPRPPRPRMKKD